MSYLTYNRRTWFLTNIIDGSTKLGTGNQIVCAPNGRVGIGTESPAHQVHIRNNSAQATLSIDAPANQTKGIFLADDGTNAWRIEKPAGSNDLVIGDGNFANSIRILKDPNLIGVSSPRVVIGAETVSPAYSNQFGGNQIKLSVDGVGVFKEIAVLAPGQWADYVFDKDYKLLSLDSVASFINQNHHLPDVPSANDVAQNGLKIGEMNAILLRKIEELTLYIIDLKKELETIKRQ
jgi:hypothetical protein